MDNFSAANYTDQLGSGDAQVMKWGNTDAAISQLQQQQRQRQAQGYQDYVNSTNALSKEFANVRSADIPDVVNAYQTYKQLRQQMLFDPKLQRDPVAYAKAQQAANAAQAEVYGKIAASTETKEFDKGLANDFLQHHEQYDDTAGNTHAKAMQMTTAQRQAAGLNSAEPYLYKGSDFDLQKSLKDAAGTPQKNIIQGEYGGPGGFTATDNVYSYGNSPAQFAASLIGKGAERKAGQTMAKEYNNVPPAQVAQTQAAYQQLLQNKDYWSQARQNPAQNDLTIKPEDADAVKYAKLQAMQYALANQPKLEETKQRVNEAGKLQFEQGQKKELDDYQLKNKINFEGIRQGNREALAQFKNQFKNKTQGEQSEFLDKYITSLETDAKAHPQDYKYANGKTEQQFKAQISPQIKKIFEVPNGAGHYIYPDEVRFLKNGDVMPIFYQRYSETEATSNKDHAQGEIKEGSGGKAVDTELSQPIKREDFKIQLGRQILSKKALNADLENDDYETGFVPNKNILSGLNSYLNNAG
jgi:hypothetical protein